MATPRYATLHHLGVPPPTPRTATLRIRLEDKATLDALAAWWHYRRGERIDHDELLAKLLDAALRNERGPFAGALDVV